MDDSPGGRAPELADVVAVGAGITGLALCRELAARGRRTVVLESDGRPGGVIRSRRVEGRVVELGPQRTRLTADISDLVEDLGLEDELLTAPEDLPLFVYRDGRLRRVPSGPLGLLGTDLLSASGKLRVLAEPLAGPPREGETAASYLRRSFGEEAYRHVLGPLFGGIYASDPDRMPVRYSLVPLWRSLGAPRSLLVAAARRAWSGDGGAPACSFRAGLASLTDALHDACGDRVRLDTRVSRISPRSGGVDVVPADGRPVRAAHAVLTVPADEAGDLLRGEAPGTERLGRLRYNPLAVVHLLSPLDRRGYGYQVSLGEPGFATRGVTWNASLFGRDGVHTAYLGGMDREEVVGREEAWLGERAALEFEAVTGAEARAVGVHRTRVPAHDESWRELESALDAVPERVHLCANYESPAGIPARVRRARELAREIDRSLEERPRPRDSTVQEEGER